MIDQWVIGVDEVGRGPLAGPVTAAAVLLPATHGIHGLDDSKKLSEARRDALAPLICSAAGAWSISHVDVADIDRLNILHATMLAMQQALASLRLPVELQNQCLPIRVDGNRLPDLRHLCFAWQAEAVIGGDAKVPAISAASIIAKTARDALMRDLDQQYPGYGLAGHKGYGTAAHLAALKELGPSPIHRRSFAPVRAALAAWSAQRR